MHRLWLLFLYVVIFMTPFAVSAQTLPPVDPTTVSGDFRNAGSSALYQMTSNIATRFSLEGYLGAITTDQLSTADGFQQFCSGQSDIALADRQINEAEINACTTAGRPPLAFRVATDAVIVVVSRRNTFAVDMTASELQAVFSTATNWSDVRPEWPQQPIQRFGPGTTSKEFAFFATVVYGGDTRPLTTAIGAQFNDDVTTASNAVVNSEFAIGFFNAGFVNQSLSILQPVAINGVPATTDNITNTSYPLARPLLIYSSASVMQSKPQVASFINYYLTNVGAEIGLLGLYQAPPNAIQASMNVWMSVSGQTVQSPTDVPQPVQVVAQPTDIAPVDSTQPVAVEEVVSAPAAPFTAEVQNTLVSARLDLELLATEELGTGRPDGWSGSLDVNSPQLPLFIRLDLELLAALSYGQEERPAEWFGAVSSTQEAVVRDIRHDLEVLADFVYGDTSRPDNWAGDNPIYRCDRSTQALVALLQQSGLFTFSANPLDPAYCAQTAIEVSRFTEISLLASNTTAAVSAPRTAQIDTDFAIAFTNRNAANQVGVIPEGSQVSPIARSYVQFSNMTLVEGDGFRVFVEYQSTSLTSDEFNALPNEGSIQYETYCDADWCANTGE